MISRRNIRIKVMQTLYTAISLDNGANGNKAVAARILEDKLEHVLDIFTVSVLFTLRIAQFAEQDALHRASKYLRTEEDMNVDTQIAKNTLVQKMFGNKSFNDKVAKSHLDKFINDDWVKKIYLNLVKTDEYQLYIVRKDHTQADDKNIIKFIWEKQMLENEGLMSYFLDELPGWEDDSDLIIMLMQNFFSSNTKVDFMNLLAKGKRDYAHELLQTVIDKEEHCLELIAPKLNNWDKERVALIDLLLIKMGVCEFLYFPTIPTKVTINEFIDIAKQYSTPQSGQFVNGVLDNILKDLVKENRINKESKPTK